MCVFQVLDKYGDIYGRERIAELLGVDLASLDVSQQHEKKQQEPDNSMFAWYSADLTRKDMERDTFGSDVKKQIACLSNMNQCCIFQVNVH